MHETSGTEPKDAVCSATDPSAAVTAASSAIPSLHVTHRPQVSECPDWNDFECIDCILHLQYQHIYIFCIAF